MESKADVDFTWNEDRAIVDNPSTTAFLVPNCSNSTNGFLPLAIQPLLSSDPHLKNVAQTALQFSDAVCYLQGGLSRHETAAVWMLLHSAEWQKTYLHLQNLLIRNNKDDLSPFLPYLKLLNRALQTLPKLRGNLWYYCDKDVQHLYRTGSVFNWPGFLRCKVQSETTLDESNSQTGNTIFCIETSSGRMIIPFSHIGAKYIPVVIPPNTFFQVISVSQLRGNVILIGLKEIHSPYALEPRSLSISDQDAERSSQQYWDSLLQEMDPVNSCVTFLSVRTIAHVTANIRLYCSFLQRLSEMPTLQYTTADSAIVLSTNLEEMKRFPCHIVVQLFGTSVLNALYSKEEFKTSQVVDTDVQNIVLEAMYNHKDSEDMIQTGLKFLFTLANLSVEFDQPQHIVDVVLSSMKYHTEENDIQTLGCSLMDSLSQNVKYVSFISERQGREVILNTIRVHGNEEALTETCWRVLLRLVKYNNTNNCTDDDCQDTTVGSFFEVMKYVLKAYSKLPSIQAEGLTKLRDTLAISANHMSADTSYLELTLTAIRTHGSCKRIVDCSFGILVEFTKSSELTNFLVNQDALRSILSAMSHHFNTANIQEHGCKILQNIAVNGCRGYPKDRDVILDISSPISNSEKNPFDYRLKVVESGGIDVIISAMKTHINHIGTQREGCLAIRTLSVNADNVVESRDQEDVMAVLATFSKTSTSDTLLTAALRALAILTIHPLNRDFVILNSGVECVLSALRTFPACVKIVDSGVAILANLSQVTDGALNILRGKGLQLMLMLMESDIEHVLASVCTMLANVCSLPLRVLKADDRLPIDIMCDKGGYQCVTDLMNRFPTSLQIQRECCRLICRLPREGDTRELDRDTVTQTVFKFAQKACEDVELLSLRCRAVGRVMTVFDIYDSAIPDEIIDVVLSMMQQYSAERSLIRACCLTLYIMTVNGIQILSTIVNKNGVICMTNCLKQHQSDKHIMKLSLKILRKISTISEGRAMWEFLNPFLTPVSELIRRQIASVDGMNTLFEIVKNNFEDHSILLLVAPLFLIMYRSQKRVTDPNLVILINKLIKDIRRYYSDDDLPVRLFCGELSHLVNL